jgi:hypothetical protein
MFAPSLALPTAAATTFTRIVALDPFVIQPRLQLSIVVPEQLPWDALTDENVTPLASALLRIGEYSADGPWSVTVTV